MRILALIIILCISLCICIYIIKKQKIIIDQFKNKLFDAKVVLNNAKQKTHSNLNQNQMDILQNLLSSDNFRLTTTAFTPLLTMITFEEPKVDIKEIETDDFDATLQNELRKLEEL